MSYSSRDDEFEEKDACEQALKEIQAGKPLHETWSRSPVIINLKIWIGDSSFDEICYTVKDKPDNDFVKSVSPSHLVTVDSLTSTMSVMGHWRSDIQLAILARPDLVDHLQKIVDQMNRFVKLTLFEREKQHISDILPGLVQMGTPVDELLRHYEETIKICLSKQILDS